jgi:hypothetical protein
MANITMSYGTYTFSPVPIINISKEYKKTEDNRILSVINKLSLDGTLINSVGSVTGLMYAKDTLSNALTQNGCLFNLNCNGDALIECRPKVLSLSFKDTSNHWNNTIGYSAELEYEEASGSGEISNAYYLDSASEDWQLEPMEDKPYFSWTISGGGITDARPYLYKLTHNISAKGRNVYDNCSSITKEGWQYAGDFCSGLMGTGSISNPILSLPDANYTYYNYNRTQAVQKYAGNYTVNENWTVFKSGVGVPGAALEDFTVDIKKPSETDVCMVGIQGSIQGLDTKTFGTADVTSMNVVTQKYAAALNYYNNVNSRFYSRAQQALLNSNITNSALNPTNFSQTLGHNISNGVINYSYEYSTKPTPCVSGALSESIGFQIDYPQDVMASITILGRAAGPIIQLMGTRTAYQYRMSIDVSVPIITGCGTGQWLLTYTGCPHSGVRTYLAQMEASLSGSYGTLAKTSDTITWNPREGKYARNVSWIAVPCAGAGTAVNDLP